MSALIGDSHRTLSEGVVTAWPDPRTNPLFARFLAAISRQTGLPLDVPFDRLDARHKRIILFGCGDRWIEVGPEGEDGSGVTFRMQYKGLYPALDDLGRMSYAFGQSLASLVGEVPCPTCQGSRLRSDAAAVRFTDRTLQELCELPLGECLTYLKGVKLKPAEKKVAGDLLREVTARMGFLVDVGLHYLTLSRTMPTLSGGESQRIRLAGQVGRSLTGVLYVLDEPTIGLHPRDNGRLLKALKQLRDLGNTLVLVEHDREVLDAADRLYDFGPGAGRFGGTIVGEGTPREVRKLPASLTGGFLSGREQIAIPLKRRMPAGAIAIDFPNTAPATDTTKPSTPAQSGGAARRGNAPRKSPLGKSLSKSVAPGGGWLEVLGAIHHNLRDAHLRIPLGTLTCVTGVSGSGKSSLVEDTLARAVARRLHGSRETPGKHREIKGLERVNKIIVVDQQPLGTTPASNPATYTGVFELIRELFTRLPDAKMRGFRPGRFSFNRPGGRCEACEGNGQKKIEMHFLPDVWVTCEECKGRRFNAETLTVLYHGKSIADVLEMSIGQARELFENIPKIRAILATLCAVGLDYLTLGQSAATLSGGEAQRVKLAAELARPQTGRTLYILDEPTTGLHFDDIRKLLKVLHSLVELGNTVVVIEHNLDVIKTADWIIDLGPEAGVDGGWIVAEGTPEEVVDLSRWSRHSYTGELLAPLLKNDTRAELELFDTKEAAQKRSGDLEIEQVGKTTKMPWQADGRVWHLETRLSHTGKPCRWEGAALESVMEKVEAVAGLQIDWNERSVIEVTPTVVDGTWFLHALTGDEWILTLKFRVPRKTFQEETLARELALKSFDDIDEVPVYGRADRVRINNTESGLQEVTITVHWLKEIDTPAFASFLEKAIQARLGLFKKPRVVADRDEQTPWAQLGRRWHTMQKGFPPKAKIAWKPELLTELLEILDAVYPEAEVNWSGRDDVVYTLRSGIVARLYTKRAASVDLQFVIPIGKVTLGRFTNLGATRFTLRVSGQYDLVMLTFTKATQFTEELGEFLAELNKPA
ncbi:MAG: ATP-binding cassette domain-containing protein, partial [Planctomycetota bacterium]|nr:ATP-binding cassette domain-containing protein [Planctomycetota bacterium]